MKDYMFLWILALSFCGALDAQVTRGQINAQGSSTAVMTINSSGVQQLSGNFIGEIVISASNVTLDLRGFTIFGGTRGIRITGSNVTVQNGTIRDATIGVRIEGDNNQLIGLDLISNTTGVEVISNNNMIHNCNALNNTAAGFSLVGASRTMVTQCSAIDTSGAGNTYGFITNNGTANIFEECLAERTQTSGVGSLYSAGFIITGTEQKSKVLNCQANNTSGSVAAGMWAKDVTVVGCTPSLSLLPSGTFNAVYQVLGVSWLNVGSSYYVASAGGPITGPEVRVLQFNPVTGILSSLPSATFETANDTRSIDWLTINGIYYLAVTDFTLDLVRVLQFDPSRGVLFQVATYSIADPISCSWFKINSSYYLAVGNFAFATVLLFNPAAQSLTFVAEYDAVGRVNAVNWRQIGLSYYLATAGLNAPRLRVLNFNPATSSLTAVATLDTGENVYGSSWLQTGTNYYIATGFNTVRAVQFDPGANTLTSRASNNSSSWQAYQNDWLAIGSSNYLVCGSANTSNNVNVFNFNPSLGTLSVVAQYSYTIGTSPYVYQPAWQTIRGSKYIAFGGANSVVSNPALVGILNFDDCLRYPLDNMIMNNQSSGNVTGFQDDAGYFMSDSTNQWLGNFGANNTTNFNIGSQFPQSSSQGLGDGVAENLDASLTNGGPAQKIMRTVVDQLITLTGPMAAKNTALTAYGITPIIGTTTLTSMRSYCLATDMSGTIFILTSSFITLDLNQHTVGNISVTNSQFLVIRNGRVSPNNGVTDGISFTSSSNILLQNVDVANAQNGLIFANTTGQDSAMMVQNCIFNNNSQIGFRIVTGTFPNKPRDIYCYKCAARNNGSHGFSIGSEGSKYYQCEATNNGGRGFTLENTAVLIGVNNPASTDIHNLFAECVAMNNTGTGFHMQASQSGNVVAACYARGNGGANYSNGVMWGVVTDSTSSVEYWQNYAQPTP